MGVKTRQDYLSAFRGLRPNIYKFGELVADVTAHPAIRRVVESHARNYGAAHDPELPCIYTTTRLIHIGEDVSEP